MTQTDKAQPSSSRALDRTLSDVGEIRLITRDRTTLTLRPASIADAPATTRLFERIGAENLALRFLMGIEHVKPQQIVAMLEIDHRDAEHLLVFVDRVQDPVASLFVASDKSMREAEVAIAIDEDWRGKGIGWTLLQHAVELARSRGFKVLRSLESRAAHDAIEVERAAGFTVRDYEGASDMVSLEKRLD